MVLALGCICLVCSALLGLVNHVTAEPIAAANLAKTNSAIAAVVPEFDNVPSEEVMTVEVDGKQYNVFPATYQGKVMGYAVEVMPTGFGGVIDMLVGFDAETGIIYNTSVISHSETPGLGAKITETGAGNFRSQFDGMNPATTKFLVKQDGGDIDAITASTITSRAFTSGVAEAYKVYLTIKGEDATDVVTGASNQNWGE
ncbi:MAG: RnfABCDGE type electron transport complex subunit G [Bacteroidales bacterium]|nr:RnfABCDGE type electron transport complex subunit G [Bacteroidales bacterium]MBO7480215.1 RnfABCDGE type electron transport complex subunit G [Bacteroidales bacterium]MBO7487015.1 RnfABCDGE type electron transport complex subunit G [Bacteroidales bacterium]